MDITYFTSVFLVFLRVLAFFIAVQVIFPNSFPNVAKIVLSFAIAFFIMPYINVSQSTALNNGLLYLWQCMCETITGLILGFFANLAFISARIGGQFIDFQIGFGMMSSYDPTTESNASLIERLLNMFAIVVFFSINGQEMLISQIVDSFKNVKLGTFVINSKSVLVVFNEFIQFFIMGFKIALPIILVLIITDIVLGLMSRTVPQLNVMILGLPIKILLGLTCLMMILPIMAKFCISAFSSLPDIYKQFYKLVPVAFVFADSSKTENATPRKLEQAKKKGQIAKSREVPLAVTLLVCTIILAVMGDKIIYSFEQMMSIFLQSYLKGNLTEVGLKQVMLFVTINAGKIILLFCLPVMVFGIAANIFQTGFVRNSEALKPDIARLNPISGFKRMFSIRTVVDLLKDLSVITIIGIVGYKFIMNNYKDIANLNNLMLEYIPHAYLSYIVEIFKIVTVIMIIIASFDFAYQKYQFKKDMKMTKQEVKDEFKQDEGDPEIKNKRKQRMREIIRRTMLNKVPDATVVITNPTHLAVAIKYERGVDRAPIVVAKGADRTAIRIKEIAKENDVPIMENKPLARLIFKKVDIDEEVPVDMYEAVAEILALVYKLKKKQR